MSENKQIVDEIIKELNSFLINNDKYSKKELETVVSVACRNAYDKYKGKSKGKKNKKGDDEEDKPKKKQPKELMKEIGELWKEQKGQ